MCKFLKINLGLLQNLQFNSDLKTNMDLLSNL